jgi:hypothetical protein
VPKRGEESKSRAAARSKKVRKKITVVHEHPRHVPVSQKNPDGIATVDQHLHRLPGTFIDREEIKSVAEKYNRSHLIYPTSGKFNNHRPKGESPRRGLGTEILVLFGQEQ